MIPAPPRLYRLDAVVAEAFCGEVSTTYYMRRLLGGGRVIALRCGENASYREGVL